MILRTLVCAFIFAILSVGFVSQSSAQDIVLYASQAPVKVGNWSAVGEDYAAGSYKLLNPDAGQAKVVTPLANPSSYVEMSFFAYAGQPYHLWMRGKAAGDSPFNDSVHVQFSSSVTSDGSPIYRIGTLTSTEFNLEDCYACGVQGWGWQDNGWGGLGPNIYFASTGIQTIRIQPREDGLSVDQIVLSPGAYLSTSPGAFKNDGLILTAQGGGGPSPTPTPTPAPIPTPTATPTPPPTTASEIVLWASNVSLSSIFGGWVREANSTAAGQIALHHPDFGAPKVTNALASPANYFDVSFNAQAGTAYRLWIRGRADGDYWANDSVFVQFSGSQNSAGAASYRIGTSNALEVNLEDCAGCGVQGWGWQDDGWGTGVLGPLVYFQNNGTQTLRIQTREDGFSIDQIVLSPSRYLTSSPGTLKNDVVILTSTGGAPQANQPPQVSISASPTSGAVPLFVNFSSSASDPDGYIASYFWNFGDGYSSTIPNPVHAYSGGAFVATLTVTDNSGATKSASVQINVSSSPPANQPPQVSISASPTSGAVPLFVNFSSSASDPDGYIASYFWNFGDGYSSTIPNPVHAYSGGVFVATLTVTDNSGATKSASVQINVSSAPPPPPATTQLRVLSWNMSFAEGTDAIVNYDRIATYIANYNPDLIALCEMPPDSINSLVSLLAQKTGRQWFWHFVAKYPGCPEGNLILSKFSFVSTSSRYLSYERSVAQVSVTVGGRNINFFATHLDASSSSYRYPQVTELMSFASGFGETRIIAGDFNAGPDLSEVIQMSSSYFDSWVEAMNIGTAVAYPDNPVYMHTRTRRGRIDYIFYSRGSGNLVLKGSQIPDVRDLNNPNVVMRLGTLDDRGVRPSDHNLVITNFEIR